MKKIILLSLCYLTISLCTVTYGQEPNKTNHEFSVRWGTNLDLDHDDPYFLGMGTPLDKYNSGKYYYGNKIHTKAITLSYANEMTRWITLTVNTTYSGTYQLEHEIESKKISDKYRKHKISVYPMVRFTYHNRPMVRLYSAIGFGLGVTKEGWSNDSRDEYKTAIDGQLTLFGVSVGKKLFVSWEIGVGNMGFLNMGGGYRF